MSFLGATHFNITIDESSHAKKSIHASILYSWQTDSAAYGDIQYTMVGKALLASEQEFPDEVRELIAERKQERFAAFRQLQASRNGRFG